MAKFNPEIRILWEGAKDNLNVQVKAQIADLESEAAEIRKAGDAAPELALQEKVDALRGAIARARLETVQAIGEEIDEVRNAWEKDRNDHPERELAQIRRAENEVDALSDDEVIELADLYEGGVDLCLPKINMLKTRLRRIDDSEEQDAVKLFAQAIEERHGLEPWISEDAGARALASYRADLNALEKGEVLYAGEYGRVKIDVGDLIDYAGELDSE